MHDNLHMQCVSFVFVIEGALVRRASFWAISDPYPWDGIPNEAVVMRGDVANLPNCGPSTFRCY